MKHALLALALLVPAVAWADPKDDARRHFLAGLESAKTGDYDVALQRFLAAQDAWPHPATLYNIARTYSDLDDLPNALTYYRLFRDASPDRAGDVDPVIAVLEARLNQRPAAATPAPGVVVAGGGPTLEEIARLQSIAAELEALATAISERPAGTAEPTPEATAEAPPDVPEVDTGALIDEAYERVVVTASRYGQDPLDSPSTVTVLTEDDLRLSGVTTLPDLLRRVVGVEVMSLSAGHTDVSIRGFNRELSNKVLILVDGRSTYWDFVGTTLWSTLPIALEEIERVEVIRGPGSAVYGANAVTGVINIITRTPGEGGNLVKVSAGLPGLAQGTILATGREGETSWRLSAGFDEQGRWARDFDEGAHSAVVPFTDRTATANSMVRANGRVDRTFAKSGLASLSAGYSQGLTEYFNLGALGDFGIETKNRYVRGDLAYGPVHLRAFWNATDGRTGPWTEAVDAPRSLATGLDSDTVDVELESSGALATGPVEHRVNGGVGYRYKRLSDFLFLGKDGPLVQEHHVAAFLNEEATLGPVKVVASLRADRHPVIPLDQTLSPRGAAIVRVRDRTSVRVSGGTAFRQPTLIESYMDFDLPTTKDGAFIRDFGSTELRPERIATAELGVHDESSAVHTADVAIYVNQLRDVVSLSSVRPAVAPYDGAAGGYLAGTSGWVNRPEVYTGWGVEAEGELFPADGLDLFANANVERIVEASATGSALDGSSSLLKLNAGAAYRTPWRTDVSASVHYASPQTWRLREFDAAGQLQAVEYDVPARVLVSARVAVRPLGDDALEVAATVWNATALSQDARWQEHPKGQPVGARAFGSVTWKF